MSEELRDPADLFVPLTIAFGLIGLFNSYYGYYCFHYQRMQELSVAKFLSADFPKRNQEYLVTGIAKCSNPMDVSIK